MLVIHRAERADILAEVLAGLLADVAEDPFATQVVAVPTRGIERWLAQRLSATLGARPQEADGVCANIAFPFPSSLVADTLAQASGITPTADPWQPARLVWPLIELAAGAAGEPWLQPLAQHIERHPEQRYSRLAQLAMLYHSYGVHRPELLESWARGEPGPVGGHSAAGWQRELWQRLRGALGVPSPAERLAPACAALAVDPGLVELPQRVVLFGLTRLPASHLRVLRAVAAGRDVHLMLLHPSPAMWSAGTAKNRLLASWGRDIRGLQQLVSGLGADQHHPLAAAPGRPDTLLAALQADIRSDRPAPGPALREGDGDARLELSGLDRSVQVHACHGRARQVEVLREAILHRLADDPSLEPRDVFVMCPDIETFAPLIEASFAATPAAAWEQRPGTDAAAAGEPPALGVRLADRSPRHTTPILAVVARLLELATGRVSASEVLDLADAAPVRARFGFDDDELAQIRRWVASAQIHWGLDARGRAAYKLGAVEAGTWADGLRRLLLGVAVGADAREPMSGVMPAAAVQSSQVELAGRLGELVDRLDATLRTLAGPHTVPAWAEALSCAADMLTATPPHESWQRRQLEQILGELVSESSASPVSLCVAELRAMLAGRLAGRPTRAGFRTGQLTFCTLVPMRSVPHRVVCLLGLDDGCFPRPSPRGGDDLLLADPHPGDGDPRTEDRQLLLDALLAAQDALIITYSGHDERTNAPLPPAVPVGELLDTIDATARAYDTRGNPCVARDRVVIRHPLQAFDPRNFWASGSPPALAAGGPWSFSTALLAGARAYAAPRRPQPPFLTAPLPIRPEDRLLTLEGLVTFVQRPVRAFLRERLGLTVRHEEDEIDDALPIELDALASWAVGERLLGALRAGAGSRAAYVAEIARGTLPPGALGAPVIRSVLPAAKLIADSAAAYTLDTPPRSEQTNLTLSDGTRLTGTVSGIHGHVVLDVSYARLGPRQVLAAWIRLLALSAAHPETAYESVTIGRGDRDQPIGTSRLPPLPGGPQERRLAALSELERLAELRLQGLSEPQPLPCKTAHAYAYAALRTGSDPVAAAMRCWHSRWVSDSFIQGEASEPEHRLALGSELDLPRLAQLAVRLWQPLLDHAQAAA